MATRSRGTDGKRSKAPAPREDVAARPADPSDLEAVLRNQLESLAASLNGEAEKPPMPVAEAPQAPPGSDAPRAVPAPAMRSEFAPDPIRQRTYYDLKSPPKARPRRPAATPVPARRAAVVSGGLKKAGRRWLPASSVFYDDVPKQRAAPARPKPAHAAQAAEVEARRGLGLDARTLSIAAIVGIGIGFVALTAATQFGPSDSPEEIAAMAPVTMSAKTPEPGPSGEGVFAENVTTPVKQQSRVLPNQPMLRYDPAPETETIASDAGAGQAVASARPAEARTSQPAARRVEQPGWEAASPFFEDSEPPQVLSYAPVERAAPARRAPAGNTSATVPAANKGAGTGRVNTAVNMRSGPDNNAAVVAVLAAGTAVKIEKCDYWCTVVADGKRGYVFRKFVGR
ncbi:MAG: SH3 domain-containing protein [Bauldia sp.]|uniref:SH3 domain-containing protein n=1 Tax=Bauldia sp. TaxID=2575872 RepID=UPI001DD173AF|nr:SH3 domain-containing protein [Bauldia sp.]MCB1496241.1 SH3 domain-containing protein [Bauldia sp.]